MPNVLMAPQICGIRDTADRVGTSVAFACSPLEAALLDGSHPATQGCSDGIACSMRSATPTFRFVSQLLLIHTHRLVPTQFSLHPVRRTGFATECTEAATIDRGSDRASAADDRIPGQHVRINDDAVPPLARQMELLIPGDVSGPDLGIRRRAENAICSHGRRAVMREIGSTAPRSRRSTAS